MKIVRTLSASTLVLSLLLVSVLGLAGCSQPTGYTKYTYQFYGTFDTLVQFVGYARSQAEFDGFARKGEARLVELHRLFDTYNGYAGLANAKTVNDQAGIAPVSVAKELVDLVLMAKEWFGKTGGKCSIALGPVTSIWKKYRDRANEDPSLAQVPPLSELQRAAELCDVSKVVVDADAGTVFLEEKGMALDLGAVAKGQACEIVAKELEAMGLSSVIVDGGGNIRLAGRPLDGRRRWGVGIQNPDGDAQNPSDAPLDIVFLHDTNFVTSGDYQRFFLVDGKRYCHLVDPDTLMPSTYFRAVAVTYPDGGIADFLSTTLFLMPYEQGLALAETIPGLEVLWILDGNEMRMTDGMKRVMKTAGNATSSME